MTMTIFMDTNDDYGQRRSRYLRILMTIMDSDDDDIMDTNDDYG